MRFPLKEILILLYLAAGYGAVWDRLASLGLAPEAALYLGLFGLLTFCLLLASYVASTPLRLLYALILSGSAMFLDSTQRIMGEPLSYEVFINLVNSTGFAGEALSQHGASILRSLPASLLLFAGIALKPLWQPPLLPRFAAVAAPIAGVALLSLILFARGGEGGLGLPGAFAPLSYSSLNLYESATGERGVRQQVSLVPGSIARPRDVILIVDESVAGQYLDLNSPAGARSGLMGKRPGLDIHNYGYAAAITHCSVGTNVTLRHGGTRDDYQRINATMPSIWAYAREAGFRSVYIDGQRTAGAMHNLMDDEEIASIDDFIQFDSVPVRDRDMAAADALAALTRNGRADFVLVNKVGAHFPIHDKYPESFMRHRPALPRGQHEDVSDTGSRDGFGGAAEDWRRYRNAYRNTLSWNVGAFFNRLFARADLSKATIVYTSDHGQDLHERGSPGLNTHCSGEPVQEEGLVPLVVIEGAGLDTLDWEKNLAANRKRVSHYQIFPTLLALMGYRPDEITRLYGDSLIPRSSDPFTFNVRFNARLGRAPVWKRIDPARVAPPPPGDSL
jgi:hypothetical protein